MQSGYTHVQYTKGGHQSQHGGFIAEYLPQYPRNCWLMLDPDVTPLHANEKQLWMLPLSFYCTLISWHPCCCCSGLGFAIATSASCWWRWGCVLVMDEWVGSCATADPLWRRHRYRWISAVCRGKRGVWKDLVGEAQVLWLWKQRCRRGQEQSYVFSTYL